MTEFVNSNNASFLQLPNFSTNTDISKCCLLYSATKDPKNVVHTKSIRTNSSVQAIGELNIFLMIT